MGRSRLTAAKQVKEATRVGRDDEGPTKDSAPDSGGLIVMGEVLAAYGVQGWLKARIFTASPSGLVGYPKWWLARRAASGGWREFAVREARVHGDALVARLEGFETREDVAPWRGASIAVPRSALPPLQSGEIYLADLIGIEVVNRPKAILGTVVGLIDTGVHPVLRVVDGGRQTAERLIPLVAVYVDAIDLASRRMIVDWPADF